jgi:hypothetical protein
MIVVLLACLAGFLGTGLALSGVALASTGPGDPHLAPSALAGIIPSGTIPLGKASPGQTGSTFTYTCDFSNYGTGIPAATTQAAVGVGDTSWPVNQPDDVVVVTDALALPTAVSSQLTGVDSIAVSATATAVKAAR